MSGHAAPEQREIATLKVQLLHQLGRSDFQQATRLQLEFHICHTPSQFDDAPLQTVARLPQHKACSDGRFLIHQVRDFDVPAFGNEAVQLSPADSCTNDLQAT